MFDLWVFVRWLALPLCLEMWWSWYAAYTKTGHWTRFSRWHRSFWTLNGRCDICGRRKAEQVHHKSGAYSLMWFEYCAPWRFQNLCLQCHERIHRA